MPRKDKAKPFPLEIEAQWHGGIHAPIITPEPSETGSFGRRADKKTLIPGRTEGREVGIVKFVLTYRLLTRNLPGLQGDGPQSIHEGVSR